MGGMYYCVIDLSFILIFPNCFFPNLFSFDLFAIGEWDII